MSFTPPSNPENLPGTVPEEKPISASGVSKSTSKSLLIAAIALPLIAGAVFLFKPGSEPEALADPTPPVLTAADLRTSFPAEMQEGRATELRLHLQLSAHQAPVKLQLSYADTSYEGKAKVVSQKLEWKGEALSIPLIFESPGKKSIALKDAENHLLKTLSVDVKPFPASVFPKQWDEHKNLENNPARFHIWANLYYDAKAAPNQRQYVQISYDGQLIDRFLISSGAAGHVTPTGKYKLGFKDFYPRSARYNNTAMPFWSAINVNGVQGEYGFHSLEGGGYLYLLGRPASHGCIRLSRLPSVETDPKTGQKSWGDRGGARWIFDRVPPESPVTIFNSQLPDFKFQDYEGYLTEQMLLAKKALADKKQKNG
jgi:hypothetical protein